MSTGGDRSDGSGWPGSTGYRPPSTVDKMPMRFLASLAALAAVVVAGGLALSFALATQVWPSLLMLAVGGAACGVIAARRRAAVVGLFVAVAAAVPTVLVTLPIMREVFAPHQPGDGEDWFLLALVVMAVVVPIVIAAGYAIGASLVATIDRR